MKRTINFKCFLAGLVMLLTLSSLSFGASPPTEKDNSPKKIELKSAFDVNVSQVAVVNAELKFNLVQAVVAVGSTYTILPAKAIVPILSSVTIVEDTGEIIRTSLTTFYRQSKAENTLTSLREHPRIQGTLTIS